MSDQPFIQLPIDDVPINIAVYRYVEGDFIFIDFNKMAEKTEKIRKKDLLGRRLTEVFPRVKEFGLFAVLLRIHEKGGEEELDLGFYEDERISGWRHNRVSRLPNGDVIAFYQDMTQQKILEEEGHKQKKLFEKAQTIAHVGSWEWDIKTDEIRWSDEVFRIFGEEPQSFTPTYERFLSYLGEEDRESLREAIADSIDKKTPYFLEHEVQRRDGRVSYLQESGNARFDERGKAVSMIGVVLDITQKKQNELAEERRHERIKSYHNALMTWAKVDYQNIQEAIEQATRISAETLNIERSSVWLYKDGDTKLECICLYSRSSDTHTHTGVLESKKYPHYFKALETQSVLVINDAENDPVSSDFLEEYLKPLDIRSMLDIPIVHQGSLVGVVCNEDTGKIREWLPEEVEFTKAIANNVSLALEIEKRRLAEDKIYRLTDLIDSSDTIVFYWKAQKNWPVEYVSNNILKLGYTAESFLSGRVSYTDIIYHKDLERVMGELEVSVREQENRFVQLYRIVTAEGDIRWVDHRTVIERDSKGVPINYLGTIVDTTDIEETKEQLKLLGQAIEQMDEMVRITDKAGIITYVNDAMVTHTGYSKEELIGKKIGMFKSGHHHRSFYEEMWETILSGKTYKCIFTNKKKNKKLYYEEEVITPIMDNEGNIQYFVATSEDITERVHMEERLKKLATIDSLTGIYNRYKSNEELDIEIGRSKRYDGSFALAMFDIDRFKAVNDSYGHDVGDYVLKELSSLVSKQIRESDRFGRWGGEEFLLILPTLGKEEALRVTDKLREIVAAHPFKEIPQITISVGVTVFREKDTKETMLKRVDDALYQAKDEGRNRVKFH